MLIISDCLGSELLNVPLSAGVTVSSVMNYSNHRKLEHLFIMDTERVKLSF